MDATETGIYHAIIMCGIILLLFAVLFVGNSIWLRRKFQESERAKLEAEVITLENERRRIAAEIHDDVRSDIYNVITQLGLVKPSEASYQTILDKCHTEMRRLDDKLEHISSGLIPLDLRRKGLRYCLDALFTNTITSNDLDIQFETVDLPAMSEHAQLHIFRILQEIVFNTVKHSGANKLMVVIDAVKQSARLRIRTSDDGRGFDNGQATKPGFGLENIKSRVQFLKGEAHVDGEQGCRWHIILSV